MMPFSEIIGYIFIPLGLYCLYRPTLLLYLIASVPVLTFTPTFTKTDGQFKLFQLGSLSIYLYDYLVIILSIVTIIYLFRLFNRDHDLFRSIFYSPITKICMFLFSWFCFIGILSYLKGFQIQNVVRLLTPEIFVFLVVLIPAISITTPEREKFFNYCIVLALFLFLFGAIRYFITDETELTSSGTKRTLLGYTINSFIFPICFILFYKSFWIQKKILTFFIVLFMSLGIGFTGHRSGWLVLVLILTLYFFSRQLDKKRYLWVPFFSASIIPLVILISPIINDNPGQSLFGDIYIRIADTFNPQNKTTVERFNKLMLSFDILEDNPIIGLGRLPIHTDNVDKDTNWHLLSFYEFNKDTHNLIASTVAHEGLLGLFILFSSFSIFFRQTYRVNSTDESMAYLARYYLLALIAISLFNATFTELSCKFLFYTVLGMLNVTIVNDIYHRREDAKMLSRNFIPDV